MTDFGSIAFCVRVGKVCDPLFLNSWSHLIAAGALREGDRLLPPAIELPHHWSANSLVHTFLTQTECDTLMMVDDDMVFRAGDVAALRDHEANHPYGVVQGLCVSRQPPHAPLILRDAGQDLVNAYEPDRDGSDETIEVSMCGLAFTLIRREVFMGIGEVGDLFFRWGDEGRGEDFRFCIDAKAAGFRMGVDARVSIGHRVAVTIYHDTASGKPTYSSYPNDSFRALLDYRGKHKKA